MRNLLIAALFIFAGCSTKVVDNKWQYQSYNSYTSFEKYLMQYKLELAAIELDRARSNAKQSANLDTLARVELSSCALHVALLEEFTCKNFVELKPLIDDKQLDAYYNFLSLEFNKDDISELPDQYREFAKAYLKSDTKAMNRAILSLKPLTSKMIAASLIKEKISQDVVRSIVDEASFKGYRYAVINWLNVEIDMCSDKDTRDILVKKLKIISQ
jgi:hypothetical protein